ncbi:MAG: TRAP transporter small permease [Alphaproteobacteria bacterium]|mgnify:CR=1 FL=1|jgi:TRAP-type transport system small permease protein|nr:TRAP transporter small permease [Alphaproteobacteria bacterium]
MQSVARAVLPRILSVLENISAILLFLMMALTFVDVIGRYFFTAPVFGAAEMIQFLLAMTIFGGLSLVNARDSHITVELFEPWLQRRIPRLQPILVQTFSVVVMTIIAWQLTVFAIEAHELGSMTVVLEWPLVVVAGTVAGLSVVSLVAQILGLILSGDPDFGADHGDPI